MALLIRKNCKGRETWAAQFVYHGFQYVEIENYPGELMPNHIVAEELHSAVKTHGSFTSSNELFNKLEDAAVQSFVSNYHSYPEDCPHREKIGWTGDAQLATEMGLFHFDMISSYRKWINDFTDEQRPNGQLPGIIPSSDWGYKDATHPGYGPQWEGAFITVPWQLYLQTADTSMLAEWYPAFENYMSWLGASMENGLLNMGIDDHKTLVPGPSIEFISSAWYAYLLDLMEKISMIVSEEAKASDYFSKRKRLLVNVRDKYLDPAILDRVKPGQAMLGLAITFDLVAEVEQAGLLRILVDSLESNGEHFNCGVLGVKAVTTSLIKNGQTDLLYRMLDKTDYPSFGNWISKGATTLWQDWAGERSLNHIMFGSFTAFFFEGLAGISFSEENPGGKEMLLQPQFAAGLNRIQCERQTPYGQLVSSWARRGKKISYSVRIPGNSVAEISLPVSAKKIKVESATAAGVQWINRSYKQTAIFPSGEYTISFRLR